MSRLLLSYLKKRRRSVLLIASPFLALLITAGVLYCCIPFSPEELDYPGSDVYRDRDGRMLRILPDARGERHLWASLDEIPPVLQNAFIAAEDKRFRQHQGFDPLAIVRAFRSNIREGRIVSGASTLTQQLVRMAHPRQRTYAAKIVEIVRAIKAERAMSKDRILEIYLNRAPMGNNITGVKLAAQIYFNKSLKELLPSECSILASLPKSPSRLNPYGKKQERLRTRRDWVLKRMRDLGYLNHQDADIALASSIEVAPKQLPSGAPHLVDRLRSRIRRGAMTPPEDRITTIEASLQQEVEGILRSHRYRLAEKKARQSAVIVVDNASMEVLAYSGSMEYGLRDQGYNNGAAALRSPGSLLKPFLYGLALEKGYPISTLLEDTEKDYRSRQGEYIPKNYDRRQYGPMTMRPALGNSLNLSAVRMLNLIGYRNFQEMLNAIGLLEKGARDEDYYGLGLAIGNPEMTLEDLVTAYAMLANRGNYRPLRYWKSEPESEPLPMLSPQAAFIITDVLADPTARSLTFSNIALSDGPDRIAWKTGTSTRYRDCWMIGYTPVYTAGIWVGNFDGSPTDYLSGSTAAGPIFADLMRELHRGRSPDWYTPPQGIVQAEICGQSGMKPAPGCRHRKMEWFIEGVVPAQVCTFHRNSAEKSDLPAVYAAWLYERSEQGVSAPYALSGLAPGEGRIFDDPWRMINSREKSDVIRVRQSNVENSKGDSTIPMYSGRVTIAGIDFPMPQWPDKKGESIQIEYPLDGDHFIVKEGREKSVIRLQARLETALPSVSWYIDGMQYAETGPPYRVYWIPEPGRHRIAAVGPNGAGDEVRITVE